MKSNHYLSKKLKQFQYVIAYGFYLLHIAIGISLGLMLLYGYLTYQSKTFFLQAFCQLSELPPYCLMLIATTYALLVITLFKKGVLVFRFAKWWANATDDALRHLMMMATIDRKFKNPLFLAQESYKEKPRHNAYEWALRVWRVAAKNPTDMKYHILLANIYASYTLAEFCVYDGSRSTIQKKKSGETTQIYQAITKKCRIKMQITANSLNWLTKKANLIANSADPMKGISFWKLFFKLHETETILKKRPQCPIKLWQL